jgi:uncharacterized membrane protein YjjP (DUF1212 family)
MNLNFSHDHNTTPSPQRETLPAIAAVALQFGKLLMEAGASARQVEGLVREIATGLGANDPELRVGYASLAVTVKSGDQSLTCMRKVGPPGVNQALYQHLCRSAAQIGRGECSAVQASAQINRIANFCSPHSTLIMSIAAGIACAAFGRLLDVDWAGIGPIFGASMLSQLLRRQLAHWRVNFFLAVTIVAFLGSLLAGIGAGWMGSQTVARDMVVTVLLLVPGVPAFNAQFDMLEGRPTLGSARAATVALTLIFMTAGVWMAGGVLGVRY